MTKPIVLLTRQEVAARLRVTLMTLHRYVQAGMLPVIRKRRPGTKRGIVRFKETDVEAFLQARPAR